MSSRALTELLHGKGAHADPLACVEDLSAELAARKVEGFPPSIGQLVFHMNYWMDYELRRIRRQKPAYPEHASESFPPAPSPADAQEWDRLRKHFTSQIGITGGPTTCAAFAARSRRIRSPLPRASRQRRLPPMRRNGIGCESTSPACWPISLRWQILHRKKCSARSKPCMTEIRSSRDHWKPSSGRWSRTIAITPARSQ